MKARGGLLLLGLSLLARSLAGADAPATAGEAGPAAGAGVDEQAKREREAFVERMGRVKEGWTEQQVLEVAGETKGKGYGLWLYLWHEEGDSEREHDEGYWFSMKDGRVSKIYHDSAAARAANWKRNGRAYVAQMSKVKEGWSEQQVVELVGEPPYKENGRWRYSLHDRGAGYSYEYGFTMRDGKVAKIEHSISCVLEKIIP